MKNEMKFKKGDIVEVINEENFYGVDYLVGTTWVVARDQVQGYSQVHVYDSNRKDRRGEAIFWDYNLKLIKREEKEMKFKKGDLVEVINKEEYNNRVYPVGTQLVVSRNQVQDSNLVYVYDSYQDSDGRAMLWAYNLKLVKREEDEKEMIFKVGDKVYGKNTHNDDWLVGEVLDESKPWGYLVKVLNADYQYAWLKPETVKLLLEEKPKIDLNKLTTAELREYVELVEDKENAEFLLECFIEKVSK